MNIVYTAPNRAHHYKYALAIHAANYLYAFVSGFPRLNPLAKVSELGSKLHHADFFQTLYLASLKGRFPVQISNNLSYLSKIEQDLACRKFIKDCDIFIFYNGSGLSSCKLGKETGVINIVEAVNSHVEYQEDLLMSEFKSMNLRWKAFPEIEKNRRLKEYEEADYILLPSDFVKRSFMVKNFPESKLLKVPYGFTKYAGPLREEEIFSNKNKLTILFVGSISVRKGIRYLVEAFKKLKHPHKELMIVGPNPGDNALAGIVLTSQIIFTGVLKGLPLENAYKSADIFCLPSIEEGQALVLGEALGYGLPIIATCNSGADDIITNGKDGFIVPIKDSGAILQKLQLLADDHNYLKQLRLNSFAKSKTLNDWDVSGRHLVSTLYGVYSRK